MNKHLIVVGYYNHYNAGDEQYKLTFAHIFKTYLPNLDEYHISFIDCDLIKTHKISDNDIIILGGGDILNNYFLDEIILKFKNKPNKIIAVSVGLPYNNLLINTDKLSIIDYIFIRTQQDINLVSYYFDKNKIYYLPDISYYLLNTEKLVNIVTPKHSHFFNIDLYNLEYSNFETIYTVLKKIKNNDKKIICFSFNRHIYNLSQTNSYKEIIYEFYKFIKNLLIQNYFIVFLPFNTSNVIDSEINMENDILMQNDIYKLFKDKDVHFTKHIMNIKITLSTFEIFKLFDYVYLNIPMRFHACLFSIYKKIPFIPVYTTKKIKNLLIDINWKYYYKLETDEKDIPLFMNNNNLMEITIRIINNYQNCVNQLNNYCINLFEKKLNENIPILINYITKPYIKTKTTNLDYNINIINNLHNKLLKLNNDKNYREITDDDFKNKIVNVASYYLTNNLESKYNYGLLTKMFDKNIPFDYYSEWMWILKDHHLNHQQIINNSNGLFNINYIDQVDYSNVHRSGWQFVYENIKYLNNNNSNLYLDLYIDRTFHWKKNVLKLLDIIPYKKNWIGFIHHTFDTTFSDYNNSNLLEDPEFIASLKYCKGLIVLSNYLKNQFIEKLNNNNIPIFSLVHPTDFKNVKLFSFDNFLNNTDKKILHVGSWLRNIFSFYNLNIPNYITHYKTIIKNMFYFNGINYNIRKVVIMNSYSNNYYPLNNFTDNLKNSLINFENNSSNTNLKNISTDFLNISNDLIIKNNWFKDYLNFTSTLLSSIEIMSKLSNEDYDNILSENIVFLNLVDASAVNTLIECIIRNTPIIINNHPAVIELLGENYPLYYTDNINYFNMNNQINDLISNVNNIYDAYIYIKNLDKTKFNMNYFVDHLIKIINQIQS